MAHVVADRNHADVLVGKHLRTMFHHSLFLAREYQCVEALAVGHKASVDIASGTIVDDTTGATFSAEPFPPFMQELIKAGGLANYMMLK